MCLAALCLMAPLLSPQSQAAAPPAPLLQASPSFLLSPALAPLHSFADRVWHRLCPRHWGPSVSMEDMSHSLAQLMRGSPAHHCPRLLVRLTLGREPAFRCLGSSPRW